MLTVTMTVYKPSLWYPLGYGDPTLYKLSTVLFNINGEVTLPKKKFP